MQARRDVFQVVLICYSQLVPKSIITEVVANPKYVVKLYNIGFSYECTRFNME